jgi:glutaminase
MPTPANGQRVAERLEELYRRHLLIGEEGVASYYESGRGYYKPELAAAERERFSICLVRPDGEVLQVGDHDRPFALQSISKVFVYGLALADHGRDYVLKHVGVEPSGDAFNSIDFDERNNRPYNPMVNAGALVTTDLVRGKDPAEKFERILDSLRTYAGNESLAVDEATFQAEMRTADRNRATAYLMRSNGMISGDVESILALYLRQCSVQVTCRDLAVMAATLANGGANPLTGERALPLRHVREVLSVMHTCGMYDAAGQWAFDVGVPAKSGVSGGIMALVPGKGGIGVYSPGLDAYGNSVRGIGVCREISERLGLHVFATEAEDALLAPIEPR